MTGRFEGFAVRTGVACGVAALCLTAGAWDVEHDEIAQLTGEFLPAEIKAQFDFDDFGVLMANCHFPDGLEWPGADGKLQFRTVADLAANAGEADARALVACGYQRSVWFHTPTGKAALMAMLARAFAAGEHARAAFYISVLTHAVSDEGALNHPTLLGFMRYSNLPGVDFTLRKIEAGAKNVFGFRSDGHVVYLARQRLAGYEPKVPEGAFEDAVMAFSVDIAVKQSAFAGEVEGAVALAPVPEAEAALSELVVREIRLIEDIVATCWRHRSAQAPLPTASFAQDFDRRAAAAVRLVDPRAQFIFRGIFDDALNPKNPKGTVGVVCESYVRAGACLSFPGRLLTAACGRTLRANGYAVKGLSYWELARDGFPDPAAVPSVIVFIGGTGYMSKGPEDTFAAAARAYRTRGGRLVVVGGEDVRDITGLASSMRRRDNPDVPVTSRWYRTEAGESLKMALVATGAMRRLAGGRYPFVRDPNFDGFCKPVCRMETPVGETLLELDNGRVRFPVAFRRKDVVWLPEYALFPYLFVRDDPKLPLEALTLDGFGEKVLLDALNMETFLANH